MPMKTNWGVVLIDLAIIAGAVYTGWVAMLLLVLISGPLVSSCGKRP